MMVTIGYVTSRSIPVVVFDLATLRFRRTPKRTSMSVVAASGEVLGVVDTLVTDTNEDAAFAACEHALSAGRVQRDGAVHRIALYNPYTAQTSYLSAPESVVFFDGEAVVIGANGTCGAVGHVGDTYVLRVDGRAIPTYIATMASSTRDWYAHEDR